ncbi:MAG: hypothetical protein V3W20_07000 [Candidatus Neomarinimicrobiota bacterium]
MKIIQIQGNSKLVEYIDEKGNYQRCILPLEETDIELGIPYGLPFEEFVIHHLIPNELRKRGIWTLEDLRIKRNQALGAIQAAYGQDLATITQLAQKEVNKK